MKTSIDLIAAASAELDDAIESNRRAQWLYDHKAPLEWVILTRFEIGTIKTELAQLRTDLAALTGERDELRKALNIATHQLVRTPEEWATISAALRPTPPAVSGECLPVAKG